MSSAGTSSTSSSADKPEIVNRSGAFYLSTETPK
jgi:hypothetical protein